VEKFPNKCVYSLIIYAVSQRKSHQSSNTRSNTSFNRVIYSLNHANYLLHSLITISCNSKSWYCFQCVSLSVCLSVGVSTNQKVVSSILAEFVYAAESANLVDTIALQPVIVINNRPQCNNNTKHVFSGWQKNDQTE